MLKKVLFTAVLALLAFQAPRGAAAFDFNNPSAPLTFAEVKTPAVPAPAKAAPSCKPFLISSSFGGVNETIIIERACTPENEPVWALAVEVRGRRTAAIKVVSSDYPEQRAALEKRIKSMALDGVSQEDADFIVSKTGPALKQALASGAAAQAELLAGAREALKNHLARP
ncbi:MAG: hypothetical protein PHV33_08840 [Elusimicrobiales bacterium]|nr:hypothetical protein [Elusimicrobiales bacterium]